MVDAVAEPTLAAALISCLDDLDELRVYYGWTDWRPADDPDLLVGYVERFIYDHIVDLPGVGIDEEPGCLERQ